MTFNSTPDDFHSPLPFSELDATIPSSQPLYLPHGWSTTVRQNRETTNIEAANHRGGPNHLLCIPSSRLQLLNHWIETQGTTLQLDREGHQYFMRLTLNKQDTVTLLGSSDTIFHRLVRIYDDSVFGDIYEGNLASAVLTSTAQVGRSNLRNQSTPNFIPHQVYFRSILQRVDCIVKLCHCKVVPLPIGNPAVQRLDPSQIGSLLLWNPECRSS